MIEFDTRADTKKLFHDWLANLDATNNENAMLNALADCGD